MKQKGYIGKIARINLSTKNISIEDYSDDFYRKYVGGRGVASYFLIREVAGKVDPLGPKNKIVFATGVTTGVPFPGNSRFSVVSKSPLTNGYGESEAGGFWGAELKFAGFDAIIIEGESPTPVYLWIKDGQIEIKDARDIWGNDTVETERLIKEELKDSKVQIACIGQAGENLVKYASIHSGIKHVNGRTGMGAVLGSKKLKAIAVRGTTKEVNIDDRATVLEKAKWFAENFKNNSSNSLLFELGTSGGILPINAAGILPTRNFREGQFEGAEEICGEKMKEKMVTGTEGCFACPVGCSKKVSLVGEYNIDEKYGGPEYETIAAFGSNCGVDKLEVIAKANERCNSYGMDTISTGNTIAFAMDCFEQGLIKNGELEGIELRFGNGKALLKVIEMIAFRKGFGNVLADGVKLASKKIGKKAEKIAVHSKGEEAAMHEPRGKFGVGIGFAVGPKGADHIEMEHDECFSSEGSPFLNDLEPLGIFRPVELKTLSLEKVSQFKSLQLLWGIYPIFDLCIFVGPPGRTFKIDDLVKLIKASTGWNTSVYEIMKASERAITLAKAFNIICGKNKNDDFLPPRFFEPLKKGQHEGSKFVKKELAKAINSYYRMMGWDEEGIPTAEKLQELDITWLDEYLERYRK